jgi:hypothetical protein
VPGVVPPLTRNPASVAELAFQKIVGVRATDRQRIDFYWKYAHSLASIVPGLRDIPAMSRCAAPSEREQGSLSIPIIVQLGRCRRTQITRMPFAEKSIKVEPKWVRWDAATMTLEAYLLLRAGLGG